MERWRQKYKQKQRKQTSIRITNHIPGNKEAVSKGGRQLKRIIEKYNLNTINGKENKYKEKWTREKKEQRPVIGYVITGQECMEIIKSMEIDEIKQYGSYKQNARINK